MVIPDRNVLRLSFEAALAAIGVVSHGRSGSRVRSDSEVDIFDKLLIHYQHPERHYHTDRHIAACWSLLQECRDLALYPAEIEIALWFHDAIYDSQRQDNEACSAAWAKRYLHNQQINLSVIDRICAMIMATKTHQALFSDAQLLVDIDLSILGTSWAVFEHYDRAIRQEYHWVPEAEYRSARARVLQQFLDRPVIYQIPLFRDRYEARARENLRGKIGRLREE